MEAVLCRITNGPIHPLPEGLATRRPVRRVGHTLASRWQAVRFSLGGGRYRSISTTTPYETAEIESIDSTDDDSSYKNGHGKPYDGGVMRGGVMRVIFPGDDKSLRRSTAVLVAVWFTLSYGTYGVATWNNQLFADIGLSNPYLCSFIYALSNLPGNVGSILLVERVRAEGGSVVR